MAQGGVSLTNLNCINYYFDFLHLLSFVVSSNFCYDTELGVMMEFHYLHANLSLK